MFDLFSSCTSTLLLICWDTLVFSAWIKLFVGLLNPWHAGGGFFSRSAECFNISSGFHEDAVSSEGHDEFPVRFLKIYNI